MTTPGLEPFPSTVPTKMPPWFQAELDRTLKGGERVLWIGRPLKRFAEDPSFFAVIVAVAGFGILICLSGLIAWAASHLGVRWTPRWAGPPMLIVGCITLAICAFLIALGCNQRHVCYALTNRRVLIWPPAMLVHGYAIAVAPHDITECTVTNERGGVADLILFRETVGTTEGAEIVPHGFFAINDARRVQALVLSILLAASTRA